MGENKSEYLTLVFKCPVPDNIYEILKEGCWTAASWSHSIQEKNSSNNAVSELEKQIEKMANELRDLKQQNLELKDLVHNEKFKVQS